MKTATFSQVYLHLVFSPKGRRAMIHEKIQPRIYGYIGELINNKNHKTYIVNGMPDHIHILVGLTPAMSISDLVRDIKRSSALFINENRLTNGHFEWQNGYGVFSVGPTETTRVFNYIKNQKVHHGKRNFGEEYKVFLNIHNVQYDERYLFEFYD